MMRFYLAGDLFGGEPFSQPAFIGDVGEANVKPKKAKATLLLALKLGLASPTL